MKITLLVDQQEHETLQSEFGLAVLLEDAAGNFLFDTGADTALINNLKVLDIPPEKVQQIILSHGHYDHTGGLAYLPPGKIFCCRDVAQSHYSFHGKDDVHDITMPETAQQKLQKCEKIYIEQFTAIADNIYLSGPIPRRSFEDCGGKFFHDKECTVHDTVSEEQSLLTADGILISGCCHAGIINTLEYCREVHPEIEVKTVVGGLHLRHASIERLAATADYLRQSNIKTLILLHCTGANAIEYLQKELPDCEVKTLQLGQSCCIN